MTQVQITGEGFLTDQSAARQRIEALPRGNVPVPTYIYETLITPVAAGKLKAFAQGYAVGNRFSGAIVISGPAVVQGGAPQYTLLDSDPVEIHVRPLPREGQLPGFTGAVGRYGIEAPRLASDVLRVGEPIKMAVVIRGDGNPARLIPPPPPRVRDWQVFAARAESLPPQLLHAQGFAAFTYTLIPMAEDSLTTPKIPFSVFDPELGKYVDLTIPGVPVNIEPGSAPADLEPVLAANALQSETEKEPVLSGLATAPGLAAGSLVPLQKQGWFSLVQLAPGAAFLGLWGWDRRRRYLEQHPDVVLRGRARRALRRQKRVLQRAVERSDGPAFAAAAAGALRIACSPHYPAQPEALVCGDILPFLPEPARVGRPGETVRRIFAAADAASYSADHGNEGDLLSLRPVLDGILTQLEAKL